MSATDKTDNAAALKEIVESGVARCKYCPHLVYGDSLGEILEKLAEHGEQEHPVIERKLHESAQEDSE